jgi:AcrR family transcriptional regulator
MAELADEVTERAGKPARRRAILDIAFAEFARHGFAGTSMVAIARRASASKETLYAWFGGKEALFNTVMADRIEGIALRAGAAAEQDASPANVLRVIAEDVLRFMLAVTPLLQGLQPAGPGGEALRLLGQTITGHRKAFAAHMLQWRDQGLIAFDDDPYEIVSVFVAMAEGEWGLRLATGLLDEVTDAMIEDHARRVTTLFLRGLAP